MLQASGPLALQLQLIQQRQPVVVVHEINVGMTDVEDGRDHSIQKQ